MADISKITLPNGDSYDIKDNGAVRINDGTLTGTTTAESLLSDEVVAGSLIVNGDARFVNTINGDISGTAATATKAAQDGNGNVITSTYVKKAGDTLTGALNFANNTLNLMGDDAYIGDQNVGGCIVIKGKNGATGIQFAPYSGSTSQKISIDGAGTMTITGTVAGTFSGSLSGNATSATKATQDGSGNTITSYYCTLSTNQTISGVKTFSSMPMANVGICVNNGSGTAGGVSLWNDKNVNNYGLALRQTSNSGVHGYVQGSYAIYNYITAGTASESYTRGWVFRDTAHTTNVASISGAGNAVFNGSVTVGGNTGNTSGCEMIFDSTTESVLMSFH